MLRKEEVQQMLSIDEGVTPVAYYCPAGKLSIGIGHNLEADPALHILKRKLKKGDRITTEQIQALYDYDMAKIWNTLTTKIPYFNLLQYKYQLVLINMSFNIGTNGILKFKNMLTAMVHENDEQVIKEIKDSKYYHDVTNRANRMIEIIKTGKLPDYYNI